MFRLYLVEYVVQMNPRGYITLKYITLQGCIEGGVRPVTDKIVSDLGMPMCRVTISPELPKTPE